MIGYNVSMKYATLFEPQPPVSRLVLGCGTKPFVKGQNCDELLDGALELGINAFDTARGYGHSEKVLGQWLTKRNLHSKIFLETKGGLLGVFNQNRVNERCIRSDLMTSIRNLQTDRIDYYLLHRDNPSLEVGAIVEWMNTLIDEGKIVRYGVSNWRYTRIEQAISYATEHRLQAPVLSQTQYSLAVIHRWMWVGCTSVTGEQNENEREWYRNTQFPLFAFSPLANGFLSGKIRSSDRKSERTLSFASRLAYCTPDNRERLSRCEKLAAELGVSVPHLALAYLLHSDMNVFPVVGSSKLSTLKKSVAAANISLSKEQLDYLNTL